MVKILNLRNHKTSSTRARIFALPPDGSAIVVFGHFKHLTFVDAFPNMI